MHDQARTGMYRCAEALLGRSEPFPKAIEYAQQYPGHRAQLKYHRYCLKTWYRLMSLSTLFFLVLDWYFIIVMSPAATAEEPAQVVVVPILQRRTECNQISQLHETETVLSLCLPIQTS